VISTIGCNASTGVVMLTLAGAAKYTLLGNGSATNGTAPTCQSNPNVEGIDIHRSSEWFLLNKHGSLERNAPDLRWFKYRNYERSFQREMPWPTWELRVFSERSMRLASVQRIKEPRRMF